MSGESMGIMKLSGQSVSKGFALLGSSATEVAGGAD